MLFLLFGIIPLLLIYPLLKKPKWPWANVFNIYKRRHWAWTYALYIGFMLVVWVDFQIWAIGFHGFLQILYSLFGLSIIAVSLLPKHMSFYSKKHSHHSDKKEDHEEQ
jgi:hypothetical protein